VDIRSLYRHEHVEPETLIHRLYKISKSDGPQNDMFVNEVHGNLLGSVDELDKPKQYYKHAQDWRNRLIQGDSLLVMTSLLEREGMAGKVQMIYIDPPYGIKYGSNWQMRLNDRNVKDGDDANLSGEPEVIKAFRDTWVLGIHSYLSYLRDRLLVARELLTESGSCFVQISDENVHLVRSLMDEVFGSDSFVNLITFKKTAGQTSQYLAGTTDYLIWYSRNSHQLKFRQLYSERHVGEGTADAYRLLRLSDGSVRAVTGAEFERKSPLPDGARVFRYQLLTSQREGRPSGPGTAMHFPIEFDGETYTPGGTRGWTTTRTGIERLIARGRVGVQGRSLSYIRYLDDFPAVPITNLWEDTQSGSGMDKVYVVQTNAKVIERAMLLSTDPGDLVLDPTCGSGTTAYVAEQWGRRWITTDTSRIALSITKTRLSTALYPWYALHDPNGEDVRQGFNYKSIPHVTLKSIANDEPPEEETLFDQPVVDRKKLRVTGPFTVETLQSFEPTPADAIESGEAESEGMQRFNEQVFEHLRSAGIKNGIKNENAVFTRINLLAHDFLHAEGWYQTERGEAKAYLHIGPQFGTVSKQSVNEAAKECRIRGDADWLVILGFRFDDDIENREVTTKLGGFILTKVRMHDDLLQEGLIKKDKKAASFVTIGEPDVTPERQKDGSTVVEIKGLDIYDPIRDEVRPRSVADIAFWMVDDDYDGSSFIVRQLFFCGGDKDEFDKWKKGLFDLAKQMTKKNVEQTLKVEIDDEAFDRLYGFRSHPIPAKKGRRIAVRVVSQFGEESTKVLTLA
jgi:adenine-specific DNA-methyltransferase